MDLTTDDEARAGAITSVLWRRLDRPGHESARLVERDTGATLEGAAVFLESGRPCRLDYRIECDAVWRTVAARVTGWLDTRAIAITIGVDEQRRWTLNGQACSAVEGCDDIDLSFSPATNVLPIRRRRLRVGERALVQAAWLRFPEVALEALDQVYTRVSQREYRYESAGGTFVATLETNSTGFVIEYPNLWRLEPDGVQS